MWLKESDLLKNNSRYLTQLVPRNDVELLNDIAAQILAPEGIFDIDLPSKMEFAWYAGAAISAALITFLFYKYILEVVKRHKQQANSVGSISAMRTPEPRRKLRQSQRSQG